MINFKQRKDAKTEYKILEDYQPRCFISSTAIQKMKTYVDECLYEVGWLGTAYMVNNDIVIDDMYLFDQEVHATTTEITPEGLAEFAEELLAQEDGIELWNKLRVWGHSHVRMGVTPSTQDNDQMKTFAESGHDWFIRIIANKTGDLKVDFYNFAQGIIACDVKWEEIIDEEEKIILEEIDKLYKQLDDFNEERFKGITEEVKKEMKVKVRKKVYTAKTYGANRLGVYGKENYEKFDYEERYPITKNKKDKKKEEDSIRDFEWDLSSLLAMISDNDMILIADCLTSSSAKAYLIRNGFYFKDEEVIKLWDYCIDYVSKEKYI